jgi:hypothetical protein
MLYSLIIVSLIWHRLMILFQTQEVLLGLSNRTLILSVAVPIIRDQVVIIIEGVSLLLKD